MSRVAVIDFETASHQPHSACQLGIVVLDSWQPTYENVWLIRPPRMYFSPRCIAVHGIRPADVSASPTWESIWTELRSILDGCVIVAHNVGFDAGVFSASCNAYDIAFTPFDIECTRLIAKRSWHGLSSYGLASVAEFLNIEFRHHDALEDARASAKVLTMAAEKAGAETMEALEDSLGLLRGRMWPDRVRQPRSVRRSRIELVAESEPRYEPKFYGTSGVPAPTSVIRQSQLRADQILAACGTEKPLQEKCVVLINTLLGLERDDAVGFLQQLGATVQPKINLQTHYLILGTTSLNSGNRGLGLGDNHASSDDDQRMDEVARRQKDGQPIRILSQRQLLACIPSGLAIARGDY